MESSCISWPKKERLVLMRASQILLCDGDHCAAGLLSFFEHGHNYKLEAQREATHRNNVAQQHGEEGVQDTSLLQYHTEEELRVGLLGLYGTSTIRRAIALLVTKGFLSVHQNPNPRYRFDRTHYFLFHPEEVSAQLLEIPHPVKIPDRSVKKKASCVETVPPSGKNTAPIAKLTPEPTPEPEERLRAMLVAEKGKESSYTVPEHFIVTSAMHAWAQRTFPTLDIEAVTTTFRAQTFSALYEDWGKAWFMHIRQAASDLRHRSLAPDETSSWQKTPVLLQQSARPDDLLTAAHLTPDAYTALYAEAEAALSAEGVHVFWRTRPAIEARMTVLLEHRLADQLEGAGCLHNALEGGSCRRCGEVLPPSLEVPVCVS